MEAWGQAWTSTALQEAGLHVLVAGSLKALLVLGAAGFLAWLLRDAAAAARHWVWSLALTSVLLLPVLTTVVPAWTVDVLPAPPAVQPVEPMPEPHAMRPDEQPVQALALDPPAAASQASEMVAAETRSERNGAFWILTGWAVGALAVVGYYLLGTARAGWWVRRAEPVTDGAWQSVARDVAWELYLTRPFRLVWSRQAAMPMVWGTFRPVVLLPHAAASWTPERRGLVLMHELAHIQRWDGLTQSIAQLACAIHWFNPLVWWAARQLRAERERACDDRVLNGGTRPSTYAHHLLEIARAFRRTPGRPLGATSMARRSQLEGRLLAILEPGLSRGTLRRNVLAYSAAVFASVLLPLAALQPRAQPPEEPADLATRHLAAPLPSEMRTTPDAPQPYVREELQEIQRELQQAQEELRQAREETEVQEQEEVALEQELEAWQRAQEALRKASAQATNQDVIKQSFVVAPGGRLVVATDRGSIEVKTKPGTDVQVEVVRKAETSRDLTRFQVAFEQRGDDVYVRGEDQGRNGDGLDVRFRIVVPSRYEVDLNTSGGSIAVNDLEGDVEAETSGGSLAFGQITGDVRGKTSGGSIRLVGAAGSARLHTSGGSITLGEVQGDVEAHTSGGSISVDEVRGDIDASTSGGSVTARITRQPQGACRLKTSGGTVTVYLADGIGMDVTARTSGGRVVTEFPVQVQGELDPSKLQAQINSGGPTLDLRTSAGNIHLRRMSRTGADAEASMPSTSLSGIDANDLNLHVDADAHHDAAWESGDWEARLRDAVEAAFGRSKEVLTEALQALINQLRHERLDGWAHHELLEELVQKLESLIYEHPSIEMEVDGRCQEVRTVHLLAEMPGMPALEALRRLAERHGDPETREEARRLLQREMARRSSGA